MSCQRLRPVHWQPVVRAVGRHRQRAHKLTFADIFGSYLAAQAVRRRASGFPTTSIFATLSLPKFVVGRLLVFIDSSGLEGELSLEFLTPLEAEIFRKQLYFPSSSSNPGRDLNFKLLTETKRTSSPDRVASAWQPCVPLTVRAFRSLSIEALRYSASHSKLNNPVVLTQSRPRKSVSMRLHIFRKPLSRGFDSFEHYVVTSQHFCGLQNSKSFNETSEEIPLAMDDNVV
ncbi:hypothetical protein SCHPADRAFT_897510 [Schizopora paradoxa]|uniref:Uncharacterized protein n=1 Tax=Schizopora paradoxa TaxID=27342 RepID=A0A0H2R2Y2_9AGAM|nr:hypothetical protein SCHPADRAFT_897510 [Schizopora paradoxa]